MRGTRLFFVSHIWPIPEWTPLQGKNVSSENDLIKTKTLVERDSYDRIWRNCGVRDFHVEVADSVKDLGPLVVLYR